jgi:Loader and inhibitor of phage G40P
MKTHAKAAFDLLTIAYPTWGERFDKPGIERWGEMVEEIPADRLVPAVNRLIRSSKFAPSIADIYSAAGVKVAPADDEFADLRASGVL